jgi:hypothetical protein
MEYHIVLPSDRERISCDGQNGCPGKVVYCEHIRGSKTLAFYYYCDRHAPVELKRDAGRTAQIQ